MNKKIYPICPNCSLSTTVHLKLKSVRKFDIYYCNKCNNGFTHPFPKNLSRYYHSYYWISHGIIGKLKNVIFKLFQNRRKKWLQKYISNGNIIEIGAGEGNFAKLIGQNYELTGIEFPEAKIKNQNILKVDYLQWKSQKQFNAVIFWESLEHVPRSLEYLYKSNKILDKNGLIFIEYPRFDCIESRLFKNHWFHLDPPRHLIHFTDQGLEKLLSRAGFKIVEKRSVLACEYTVWGFLESILDIYGINSTDYIKKNPFLFILMLLTPLILISLIAEIFFYIIGQSPISFIVAKKENA